ncbi:dihydropteroate synthase [Methylacidimicrobium sp. AP8]|uniref:dihydropteroate synthase n=1 Tax=Methylacidimicrobium sp. AP8 TaxID=2730359 RepID=UPI001F02351C|nr:dihydropteroate synthase [Methylacidimicrobium sp. AP8]
MTSARTIALSSRRPRIMGIINLTPDSFSDGGRLLSARKAADEALRMEQLGVDLVDFGAESTRPGAEPVPEREELRRLLPVLRAVAGRLTIPISVDTYKGGVARAALSEGAEIINDVSGGKWDTGVWEAVRETGAGYVLVHSRGRPKTMRADAVYGDVVREVREELAARLKQCIEAGIPEERIVCDVGFGFAKTGRQNWRLLRALPLFAEMGRPLLVGLSRKSFLRELVGDEGCDAASLAAAVLASSRGAAVWRVHDVDGAVAARKVCVLLEGELS